MSNDAINWALQQTVGQSSVKSVLLVLANCANSAAWWAWPSCAQLSFCTEQDRKTVLKALKKLVAENYIIDTGERRGATGQIPVYQLNSSRNGTVPNLDGSSTDFPPKQSQSSLLTGPKTGHGTVIIPKEPSRKQKKPANKKSSKKQKKAVSVEVEKIFQHWSTTMSRSDAKLDKARADLIQDALDLGFTPGQLCQAVDGCKASDWHMGQNRNRIIHDGLGLIFRDAEKIEFFLGIASRALKSSQQEGRLASGFDDTPAYSAEDVMREQGLA